MRSKRSLWANIIMSAYFLVILLIILMFIIPNPEPKTETADIFKMQESLNTIAENAEEAIMGILFIMFIVICFIAHSILVCIALIFGWLGYILKKSGLIKTFAIITLISMLPGLIIFPFGWLVPLVSGILASNGAEKQELLNEMCININ